MAASKVLATILQLRDQFTAPAKKIAESTKNINRQVRLTTNQINKMGKQLVEVGKVGVVAVGAMVAGSAKMGMEYSANIAKITTVSDTTVKSVSQMRAEIIALSNDTGASVNALAQDVYDAISSGVSTADSLKSVAVTTKLAKAGFADTSKSVDIMTTIVNGYGKSMKEASYISDVLIQTQNKGKVTVGELSESMGKVIPTASAAGVSLEQIASGYAIMTSNGIKAAESTTYMNAMINELMKSGSIASKVIKKNTGKSFQELTKSGKSLGDILAIINGVAQKNGKNLNDMFGSVEAGKAALVLVKNKGNDFNDMLVTMKNSTGETQKAFDKLNAEPLEKFNQSVNRLKNQGIELGIAILPTINKIMDIVVKISKINLNPLIKTLKDIAPYIAIVVSAMTLYKTIMMASALWTTLFALSQGAAAIQGGVLAAALVVVQAAQWGYYIATRYGSISAGIMAGAQWALNAAMKANPIGLVVTALTILAIIIYKNRNTIIKLWEAFINNPVNQFIGKILSIIEPVHLVINAVKLAIDAFGKLFGQKSNVKITAEVNKVTKTTAKSNNTPMKKYASGGIATKPSIFGEAGAEIAIPLNNSSRSKGLLKQADTIINGKTSSQMSKSTTVQIVFQGDVYGFGDFKEKVAKAVYEIYRVDGSNMVVVK